MRNTFGNIFTLTTFGESHGEAVGGIVDGIPAGIDIDLSFIQHELSRRRPGQSSITTARQELDEVKLLSGVFEGKTTGAPIAFVVVNHDQHSHDYTHMKDLFRPSHADYTYYYKYGVRDYRGGGRSSARITISRCVGGALAKLALQKLGITIQAYTSQVAHLALDRDYSRYDLSQTEQNTVRCPDADMACQMEKLIEQVKAQGDTVGGIVTCVVKGCQPGLGEPEFGKLHAMLGAAMLSINAAKGFEYGDGIDSIFTRGSQQNDRFLPVDDMSGNTSEESAVKKNPLRLHTLTNHSGGIQGGISNGEDIVFRVAFKPVATILQEQTTVDTDGKAATLKARGRHDPCVLPRAVPIVENMAAMVILDAYLLNKTVKL